MGSYLARLCDKLRPTLVALAEIDFQLLSPALFVDQVTDTDIRRATRWLAEKNPANAGFFFIRNNSRQLRVWRSPSLLAEYAPYKPHVEN
jgi:hypothetical protein